MLRRIALAVTAAAVIALGAAGVASAGTGWYTTPTFQVPNESMPSWYDDLFGN